MILQRLVEFAERIPDACPPMYSRLEFKWQIELDNSGLLMGITPLSDGGTKNRGLELPTPNMKRTGEKAPPLLLGDKAEYVVGLGAGTTSQSARFLAFRERVSTCHEATHESSVKAVMTFLATHSAAPVHLPAEMLPGDRVCFRVGDTRPVDLPSVRAHWSDSNQPKGERKMQCILCGRLGAVDKVAPLAIKGLFRLTKKAEMQIVAANKDAFLSYGAEQALTAPTCRVCGEAYANSLNYMLTNDRFHIFIGPCVFVFWTKGEEEFNPRTLISQPQDEDVRHLLDSYRTAQNAIVEAADFYAMSLSGSGSRVVFRDWLESTVPQVKANLARWFAVQHLADTDWGGVGYYGVPDIAGSLYRKRKGKPLDLLGEGGAARAVHSLIRCALHGGQLPTWLLAQAVNRNRVEQAVTRNRAALIKAVLLSQMNDFEEDYMEKLEIGCKSPGYICGRLLAELEAAQKAAINPTATLVDRYYGAASSSPALVFGNLLRGTRAHMAKLRKQKPGVYRAIDGRLQDIMADLGGWPKTLSLQEQALFALGYYHQKAANRAAAIAHSNNNHTEEE